MKIYDLYAYKQAKAKLARYEPHYQYLCKVSDYLFNNLQLPGVFDIMEQVESQKIAYYIEISECKRIINGRSLKNQVILLKRDENK